MSAPRKTDRFNLIGFGAAACVACCIGPALALLGSLSVAGLVSTLVIGGAGLIVTAAAGTAAYIIVRRRRSRASCAPPTEAVAVGSPKREVHPVGGAPSRDKLEGAQPWT
jgi:hypothetical protein